MVCRPVLHAVGDYWTGRGNRNGEYFVLGKIMCNINDVCAIEGGKFLLQISAAGLASATLPFEMVLTVSGEMGSFILCSPLLDICSSA